MVTTNSVPSNGKASLSAAEAVYEKIIMDKYCINGIKVSEKTCPVNPGRTV
jgi:hypothetical protein